MLHEDWVALLCHVKGLEPKSESGRGAVEKMTKAGIIDTLALEFSEGDQAYYDRVRHVHSKNYKPEQEEEEDEVGNMLDELVMDDMDNEDKPEFRQVQEDIEARRRRATQKEWQDVKSAMVPAKKAKAKPKSAKPKSVKPKSVKPKSAKTKGGSQSSRKKTQKAKPMPTSKRKFWGMQQKTKKVKKECTADLVTVAAEMPRSVTASSSASKEEADTSESEAVRPWQRRKLRQQQSNESEGRGARHDNPINTDSGQMPQALEYYGSGASVELQQIDAAPVAAAESVSAGHVAEPEALVEPLVEARAEEAVQSEAQLEVPVMEAPAEPLVEARAEEAVQGVVRLEVPVLEAPAEPLVEARAEEAVQGVVRLEVPAGPAAADAEDADRPAAARPAGGPRERHRDFFLSWTIVNCPACDEMAGQYKLDENPGKRDKATWIMRVQDAEGGRVAACWSCVSFLVTVL